MGRVMHFDVVVRAAYMTDPAPHVRFAVSGFAGVSIYVSDMQGAVDFYSALLGPPAYKEADEVVGWSIGDGWLSVFQSTGWDPSNVEITIRCSTTAAARDLHAAFAVAGGHIEEPEETLMFEPVLLCAATDPFGTRYLIIAAI